MVSIRDVAQHVGTAVHTDWPRGSVAQPPNRRTDLQVPRKLQNYATPGPVRIVQPGIHYASGLGCDLFDGLHVDRQFPGALDMVFGDCDACSASRCEEAVEPALQAPHSFLQAPGSRTIPVGLLDFKGQFASNTGALFAGLTLATIPLIIVYLVFNRTISKGVVLGGVFR